MEGIGPIRQPDPSLIAHQVAWKRDQRERQKRQHSDEPDDEAESEVQSEDEHLDLEA